MSYSCPLCHLRFRFASELDGHARDDHRPVSAIPLQAHVTRYRDTRPRVPFVTPSM